MWFAVTGSPVTSLNRLVKSLLQKGHDVTVIDIGASQSIQCPADDELIGVFAVC
jgi:hypothetical protein